MINFRVKKDMCPTHISIQLTFNKFVEFCRTIVATNSVKSIVFFIPTLYNDIILFKGNLCERRCYILSSYMLIWILLQKIEKLEEELKKYQEHNPN